MNQDTENFEQLRRLLALKRHEQPPPGYFDGFSRQVILRIKTARRSGESRLLTRLFWEAPWLQRLWSALEARPILAGACGVAVCGLMLTGVLYSDQVEIPPVALVPVADAGTPPGALTSVSPSIEALASTPVMLVEPRNTGPALTATPADGSLLGDIQQLRPTEASFTFPAGN